VFEQWGALGLFISAFISSTIAPGGSEALLVYLLVSQPDPAVGWLVTVATVGNTLGAMTTWLLGFLVAHYRIFPAVERRLGATSIERVRRWGPLVLLLSWLPLVGDGLCLAAGWLRVNLWLGFVCIAIGKAARYLLLAWFTV